MLAPQVNDSIHSSSNNNPAREGTIITFTCSNLELVLTGPNTTTCMSNGDWEPDPSEVACKGIICVHVCSSKVM